MNKKKILLIGNGPSTLNVERGQEIDDFEGKIARFNHYKIEGYDQYIGTRTNILVLGQLNIVEQLYCQYDYILLYQSHLDGGAGLRAIKELSPQNKVKFFPIHEKEKIKNILEMPRGIEPTSGIVAMYWFTRSNVDLYIHGFDCTDINCFTGISDIRANKCHDVKKEAIYIEFLIENNFMKRF